MFRKLGKGIRCTLLAFGFAGCGMQPIPEQGVARGEVLFQRCTPCHGDQGEGRPDLSAPPIAGLDEVYVARQLENFANGIRGKHGDDIEGIRMMPMARTLVAYQDGVRDEAGTQVNIQALAAYVAGLSVVNPENYIATGDVQMGKMTYEGKCKSCHGDNAEGKAQIDVTQVPKSVTYEGSAPGLVDQADWYLSNQITKFQNGVRGADSSVDPAGATMAHWAKQLPDEQAVKDVVSYIASIK